MLTKRLGNETIGSGALGVFAAEEELSARSTRALRKRKGAGELNTTMFH